MSGTDIARPTHPLCDVWYQDSSCCTVPRTCHAMFGTDMLYAAISLTRSVVYERGSFPLSCYASAMRSPVLRVLVLRIRYAMPDTKIAYVATQHIWYAMSSTDVASAASRSEG
eukprot:495223-Rhodomonas_salina.3